MQSTPLVSVVIPTRGRPDLLRRAIASVFAQTYQSFEVIVVVDGPDGQTEEALGELADDRVRVMALSQNVGGAEARNSGVRISRGEWIAFLDDDDEWLPKKLERQVAFALNHNVSRAFISCRFLERLDGHTRKYPSRLPYPGESICSYVCCSRGSHIGGENLQTSTLLVSRDLMLEVPFVRGLKRAQELIWQIEAATQGKADFYVLPEILSVLNSEGFTDTRRVSTKPNWRSFYECITEKRHLMEPRAYAHCIATRILADALRCGETPTVICGLLADLIKTGAATPRMFWDFAYLWLIPTSARKWTKQRLRNFRTLLTTNEQMED